MRAPVWRWTHLDHRAVRVGEAGRAGAGGPLLVIVPGLGALGYLVPLAEACSRWAGVRLLDLPGFGHPATAGCHATLAAVTRDVVGWLEQVADAPVLLVGHSTGAQVALRAALARPAQVRGLCLAGPTFPPEARRWRPLVERVLRTVPRESPRLVAATAPAYLRGRRRVVELLRSCMDDAPERVVPDVACTLLVLRGADDAVSPRPWAHRLADAAVDGRAATLPGAHNFVFSHPRPASAALHDLLAAPAGCASVDGG